MPSLPSPCDNLYPTFPNQKRRKQKKKKKKRVVKINVVMDLFSNSLFKSGIFLILFCFFCFHISEKREILKAELFCTTNVQLL
jgi:hypothetical protein